MADATTDAAADAAADAVTDWCDGTLVQPGGPGPWVGQVLPGIAGVVGADVPGAAQAHEVLGLPFADRACIVLVDGLGHANLAERAGHAPFLRSLLAGSTPLTTTFPSTTATALGSFGTGLRPGETGLLGYTVRDPGTGRLGTTVSWTDLPDPEVWQPAPSVPERMVAAGVAVTSVGPRRFEGSGLTRAALRGPAYRGADSPDDRVAAVVDALRRPGVAYLYWGDVDKTGHKSGWGSWQWGDALAGVDASLGVLARRLPRGTVLAITADHGMVDHDPSQRWDATTDPVLSRDVELVAGEPRALHVHLRPGTRADEVRDRWRDRLGDAAVVVTREQAVADGWFGPVVREQMAPVIGDLVVAMRGRATVVDSRTQTAESIALVGVHGSLTPTEMMVPWLVALT
ncbi:MAG TPA: alkaline phosphatase family protein [Cellulomonas sp.]